MSLLREILVESFLLREDADGDTVKNAVENMHPVRIVYNGPSGEGNGEREIYPVAYGLSTAGNRVVRAFQPQGATSSEVPSWKLFRLDRVSSWVNDNSRTFNPEDLKGFNENGDEQIATRYAISPVNGAQAKQSEPQKEPTETEKQVTSHPVTKGEVVNGGADASTEKNYYSGNDVIKDVLRTSNPKISPETNKNIDNVAGQNDISRETQPAPEPVPITKGDVSGPAVEQEPTERDPDMYADGDPVTKDQVDSEKVGNPLSTAFRDWNGRMDNLNKDQNEEEENM